MFQKDEWSRSVHFCVKSVMLNNKSTPFKLQCCILSHFMFISIREQEMCCYVPRECIGYKHAARHLSTQHQMILFPYTQISYCWGLDVTWVMTIYYYIYTLNKLFHEAFYENTRIWLMILNDYLVVISIIIMSHLKCRVVYDS